MEGRNRFILSATMSRLTRSSDSPGSSKSLHNSRQAKASPPKRWAHSSSVAGMRCVGGRLIG
jgi:hypothetical protein